MSVDLIRRIKTVLPDMGVSDERSFRELTTLGIGEARPIVAEPENEAQLLQLLGFLKRRGIAFFPLGSGSNLVGSDTPVEMVFIRLAGHFRDVEIREDGAVTAGGGVKLPALVRSVAEAGLGGISPLAGIPGTVGGALRMNAGCHGVEIGERVQFVEGFYPDGRRYEALGSNIGWEYRASGIPEEVIVTKAVLKLSRSTPDAETELVTKELASRREREPLGKSAGCAFRNVSDTESAGLLIDRCGLRGCRVGDIVVSDKHANYIMNAGNGSEADFITMARIIRRAVAEQYGYYLRLEAWTVNPSSRESIENDPMPPRVNVLMGGNSSEREVSLRSGKAVADALRAGGFRVTETDLKRCEITPSMLSSDVVYPVLHGGFGEGGGIQELMEAKHLHFVGSGSAACRLTMDKIATKKLLDKLAIPTSPWRTVTAADLDNPPDLKFPVIIKAPCEGSSVGIVKVDSQENWRNALQAELEYADELLVEEYIGGIEITVPILTGTPCEAVEIRSPSGFYDYDAKYIYKNGHTEYFCPPVSLTQDVIERAKRLSLYFYRAAGCLDVLRVDFIVTPDGVPMMLEANAIPGCTATSLVPKSANQMGISFPAVVMKQATAALKRSACPVDVSQLRR